MWYRTIQYRDAIADRFSPKIYAHLNGRRRSEFILGYSRGISTGIRAFSMSYFLFAAVGSVTKVLDGLPSPYSYEYHSILLVLAGGLLIAVDSIVPPSRVSTPESMGTVRATVHTGVVFLIGAAFIQVLALTSSFLAVQHASELSVSVALAIEVSSTAVPTLAPFFVSYAIIRGLAND